MVELTLLGRLKLSIGKRVAVDYKISNGEIYYAKGILIGVDEKNDKILVIDDHNNEIYIDFGEVRNMRIKDNGGSL